MGEAADESESEVLGDVQAGGGQGDKRQGQGDGQEGEPGREMGEEKDLRSRDGEGRLEDQGDQVEEGVEGESPSSQAASSFPSMTSSR